MGETVGNVVADVVGVVGAPFTGGASLLLPAALNVGEGIANNNPLQAILGAGAGAIGAFGVPFTDIGGFLSSAADPVAGATADAVGEFGSDAPVGAISNAADLSGAADTLGLSPATAEAAYSPDLGSTAAAGSISPASYIATPGPGPAADMTPLGQAYTAAGGAPATASAPTAGDWASQLSLSPVSANSATQTAGTLDTGGSTIWNGGQPMTAAQILGDTQATPAQVAADMTGNGNGFFNNLTSGNFSSAWGDLTGGSPSPSITQSGSGTGGLTISPDGTINYNPTSASSGASKGISGTSLALGALAMLGSAASRASQPKPVSTIPTTASSPGLQNTPLNTSGYINRTPVTSFPGVNWQTYGQGPEQSFFNNNQLGYRRGGALTAHVGPRPVVPSQGAHYVRGGAGGQQDTEPALLSDGEFVHDATTVADAGDGNSDAGAKWMEELRNIIREHKGRQKVVPKKMLSPLQTYNAVQRRVAR